MCADVTSEIRAVRQLSVFAVLGQDTDHAVLDEVHLFADGPLSDDIVARLEDLEPQFGQHGGDKVWISVGEQRHGGHQFTTVEVDDLLQETQQSVLHFFSSRRHKCRCYYMCCISIIIKAGWLVVRLVLQSSLIRLHDY